IDRGEMPADLSSQMPKIRQVLESMEIPILECPGFEADDVLATLAARLAAQGSQVLVVSGDRDLLQLAGVAVVVLFVGQRGKAPTRYDRARVFERFGVEPEQLPLYVALVGDTSDNIPKVKGIGPKTASALLRGCTGATELLGRLDQVPPKLRSVLSEHADQIQQSEALARLRRDVPLDDRLPAPFDAAARARTAQLFERWEFKSLQARLEALKA
ncbi:MAG TPA: 5'-3' exonuclease H3TH domain-containing protein, partial [Polyangiaceae bacterium]